MTTKVSFWLIPASNDKAFFQKIIDNLAQEYDAPTFTPHVTIYSGEYAADESHRELIEKAIHSVQSFSLKVDQLLYTEEFTKTLFVQFHSNSILSNISETLQRSSKTPSNLALNPHLSLIYQYLNEERKKELATSSKIPSEVFFDEVRAIDTPEKVQQTEDVESWKLICTRKL